MDVDFVGMLMQLVYGSRDVALGLATSGDYAVLGAALVAIVLGALFMNSFDQLISTTMISLFIFVVLQIVWAASKAEWDFSAPINDTWAAFAGDGGLSFFTFFCYFIVFAILIWIVNMIKNAVAG